LFARQRPDGQCGDHRCLKRCDWAGVGHRADFARIVARIGVEPTAAERETRIAALQAEVMHPGEVQLRALSWRVVKSVSRNQPCTCRWGGCEDPLLCVQTQPPCEEGPCGGTIGGGTCDGQCQAID